MKILFTTTLIILSFNAFSLVDYSEPVGASKSSPRKVKKRSIKRTPTKSSSSARQVNGKYGLEVKLGHETVKAGIYKERPIARIARLGAHIQTPYKVTLDLNHYYVRSNSEQLSKSEKFEDGNTDIKVGINWIEKNSSAAGVGLDLFAGTLLKKSDSAVASERGELYFGLESQKNIDSFVVGLGYKYSKVDAPENTDEFTFGNYHKVYGALGWRISGDIILALEGGMYSISESDVTHPNGLDRELKINYITPKINLILSRYIGVELGGTMSLKDNDEILSKYSNIKAWNMPEIYGETVFVNFVVSI